MRRRITRLTAKGFLGLQRCDLTFDKPVTLFIGQNNQGKSSIRDAILFALTGKCRAMRHFKDVGDVASRAAEGELAVRLDFVMESEDGEDSASIVRTAKNVSAGVDDHPALHYALNPAAFIALPARDRGKLLSDVLGGGMRSLVQEAIAEHVGNVPDRIRAEIKGSGVDVCDVDALREEVVRIRRDLKREVKDLPARAPAITEYGLPADYDVTGDETAIAKFHTQIGEAAAAAEKAKAAERNAARIVELENAITTLRDRIRPLTTIAGDVTAETLGQKAVYLEVLKQIIAASDGAKCECPVCGGLKARKTLEDRRDEIDGTLKGYQAAMAHLRDVQAGNARLDRDIDIAKRELDMLKAGAPTATTARPPDLADVQARHAAAQAQIHSYRSYKADMAAYEQKRQAADENETLIAECDRIDAALKDGGPVKAAIAAGGRQLPINQTLLRVWGMEGLRWADNGEITLGGIRIEYASESERYRAACVMGLALADVAQIGFAALDGFEVLVGDHANGFFDAVLESNLANVFVFASRAGVPDADAIPGWMDVIEVKGGRAGKLKSRSEIEQP